MAVFYFRLLPQPLLALLALYSSSVAADIHARTTPTPTVTTAPIYLPYYNERSWSLVRGSVIATDSASRTTYTIFCPTQTPPACDLSLEFPFIIVEGPDIVEFHGTYTSTYIANVECDLGGRTAATCSGYSSYKSGYTNGPHTGPTEISWTSTFTGSQVNWGTLTLTEKPTETDDSLDVTATAMLAPGDVSGMLYPPSPTSAAHSILHISKKWTMAGLISSAVAAYLIL